MLKKILLSSCLIMNCYSMDLSDVSISNCTSQVKMTTYRFQRILYKYAEEQQNDLKNVESRITFLYPNLIVNEFKGNQVLDFPDQIGTVYKAIYNEEKDNIEFEKYKALVYVPMYADFPDNSAIYNDDYKSFYYLGNTINAEPFPYNRYPQRNIIEVARKKKFG